MRDVGLVECKHDTPKGIAWKQIIRRKHWNLIPYTLIEKECRECGDTFLATVDGERILN